MKKRYIIALIIVLLLTTSCKKKDNIELEKAVSRVQLSGDLVTKKVYYHNVAEYDDKSNFFLKLFGVNKKAWIEYTGLADLIIELNNVKTKVEGNKIHVHIPKTKISKVYVKNEDANDIVFYTSDGNIFNFGSVSTSEGTEALKVAQEEMTKAVKEDTTLLRMAQTRASRLIEEKIKQFASESEYSYTIEWEYEDNE